MWLMKTLLTSGCTNQRGAGQCSMTYPAKRCTTLTLRIQLREPEYQTATWMKTLLQKLLSSITQVIAERCQLKNFATTTRWVR
ncbi:hypothetical protein CEX13_08995 [Salmonella enterica subsp. enterica serovar Montevideo]|nr:hypothetical protein [Salmonella enterica subsp. enterica serovar Montevideo]